MIRVISNVMGVLLKKYSEFSQVLNKSFHITQILTHILVEFHNNFAESYKQYTIAKYLYYN